MSKLADLVRDKQSEQQKQAEPPKLYDVILHNDDYTPFDLVVDILKQVFGMPQSRAIDVMMTAHRSGKCKVAQYTKEIAETKAHKASELAHKEKHGLLFTIEKA